MRWYQWLMRELFGTDYALVLFRSGRAKVVPAYATPLGTYVIYAYPAWESGPVVVTRNGDRVAGCDEVYEVVPLTFGPEYEDSQLPMLESMTLDAIVSLGGDQ